MKIAPTMARTRAATEKPNAMRTSRVMRRLESGVERNNHSHMQVKLDTLMHGAEWNVVVVAHVMWVDQSSLVILKTYCFSWK